MTEQADEPDDAHDHPSASSACDDQLADKGTLGHPLRGVSVHWLETGLLREVLAVKLDRTAKVYEIEPLVIRPKGEGVLCPRDNRLGAAYVDCLEGGDNASLASFMLSYTWGYSIGDIVDTLTHYCHGRLDVKKAYVWICCLCINQHRVKEQQQLGHTVPFEDFHNAFGERVRGIGKILAMMAPWRSPQYLKRVWCDFEIYTAITESIEVDIAMPSMEVADLNRSMEISENRGLGEMWSALSGVCIESADASVAEDRKRILELIEKGPGFCQLNKAVAERLRRWIVETALREVEKRLKVRDDTEATAIMCATVGNMCRKLEDVQTSLRLFKQGLRIRSASDSLESEAGAELVVGLAMAIGQENVESALEGYELAKTIREHIGLLETDAGAFLLGNMGSAEEQRGNLDIAMQYYVKAEAIREQTGTLESAGGAGLLLCFGRLHQKENDLTAALKRFSMARDIRARTDTLHTPGGAALLLHCAACSELLGEDPAIAMAERQLAEQIHQQTGTVSSLEWKDRALHCERSNSGVTVQWPSLTLIKTERS